jgi:hypothetical protein
MKRISKILILTVFILGTAFNSFSANGPDDPAGKGNGILGFGFGPGIAWYGGSGFGPAIVAHYDHSLWEVGPGTISIGGLVGTSFFSHTYGPDDYKDHWVNIGFVGRAAYHYGWNVPGLDTYAGFGAGTYMSMYSDDGDDNNKDDFHIGFLPTAFFGGSYFFNDMIGINAETGYNFTYISFGVNFRFGK